MANLGYIQVTRRCNQDCRFCSNPPNEKSIHLKTAFTTIDDFKKQSFDGVIFTGGEPTLYEKLPELVSYARQAGIAPRIISNAQKLADKSYLKSLVESGLDHIHISIHSCRPEIQNTLSNNDDSLINITRTLDYCGEFAVGININTVINKYNADHLDKTVKWLVNEYPFITHFVWNNLDPYMNRVAQNPDVIPRLQDFEISLYKAAQFLHEKHKTFRIERVPLCYMTEFAQFSTETRKIVKSEARTILFLDFRGKYSQEDFFYEKAPQCKHCFLTSICSGIYGGDQYYSFSEIFPVFTDKDTIIESIIGHHVD